MHVMAGDHTYVSNINTLFLYFRGCFSTIISLYPWLWCLTVGASSIIPSHPVYFDLESFILTEIHFFIIIIIVK